MSATGTGSPEPGIITPCNRICVVHPQTGLCSGCGRSIAEIAGWSGFSHAERAGVMTQLPARLAAMNGGGGVAARA
ncbi:MAG: DUF1289 domain-containing protein [Xanthobacteraceae bacterium]|jgi:hypothetical protein